MERSAPEKCFPELPCFLTSENTFCMMINCDTVKPLLHAKSELFLKLFSKYFFTTNLCLKISLKKQKSDYHSYQIPNWYMSNRCKKDPLKNQRVVAFWTVLFNLWRFAEFFCTIWSIRSLNKLMLWSKPSPKPSEYLPIYTPLETLLNQTVFYSCIH